MTPEHFLPFLVTKLNNNCSLFVAYVSTTTTTAIFVDYVSTMSNDNVKYLVSQPLCLPLPAIRSQNSKEWFDTGSH